MRAVNLKVNRLPSTCGIQSGIIEVSWLPGNGLIQNAFSIKIDVNGKPYFNSGIIESNEYSYKPSVAIPSRSSVRVYVALA